MSPKESESTIVAKIPGDATLAIVARQAACSSDKSRSRLTDEDRERSERRLATMAAARSWWRVTWSMVPSPDEAGTIDTANADWNSIPPTHSSVFIGLHLWQIKSWQIKSARARIQRILIHVDPALNLIRLGPSPRARVFADLNWPSAAQRIAVRSIAYPFVKQRMIRQIILLQIRT